MKKYKDDNELKEILILIYDTNNEILEPVFLGIRIISGQRNNSILKFLFDSGIIFNLLTFNYTQFPDFQEDSLKIIGNFIFIHNNEQDLTINNLYCMVIISIYFISN